WEATIARHSPEHLELQSSLAKDSTWLAAFSSVESIDVVVPRFPRGSELRLLIERIEQRRHRALDGLVLGVRAYCHEFVLGRVSLSTASPEDDVRASLRVVMTGLLDLCQNWEDRLVRLDE